MYSKHFLRFYIDMHLQRTASNYRQLAAAIGISHSNLSRALEEDTINNLTLPQFAAVVQHLQLDAAQVMHILSGKQAKEAVASAVTATAKQLVEQLLEGNGSNKIVNTRQKTAAKRSLQKR